MAALFLIAVFFVMLHAPMVGVLQVLVYAGAIMVLFLFVIMFLNPTALERRRGLWWGFGSLAAVLLAGVLVPLILSNGDRPRIRWRRRNYSVVPRRLAKSLFTDFVLPFEIASVLLLVAISRRGGSGQARTLARMMVPLHYYLILSAVIFAIGVIGVLIRRNLIVILMSIELMLNAVNLTFIAFSRYLGSMQGQVIVFFVMAVAAAEAVIGLAIVISVFRHRRSLDPQEMQLLKW